MKRVLIVSQVIPQWYVDLLTEALGKNTKIDIITGSKVKGNIIPSPAHDPRSLKSRLVSWWRHYWFVRKWASKNRNRKYDLIFAVSNPPINSYVGLKLKRQFHAPFIYMNWDLYPQVIEETIANPIAQMICKCWNQWNSHNYPKIDQILTIGPVMAKSINQRIKRPTPVKVIPVAVDTEYLKPIEKDNNPFCIENGLVDKFVVLYSGKMGLGHNIELILETAEKMKSNKDICFVFIGEGPKYSVVEKHITTHHSENIKLFPLQSDEVFPYSMACGDVGIVSQEAKMAHLFMPSKTYSMMACGMAIIGVGTDHDDLFGLISMNDIGETVVSESILDLTEKIGLLYEDREKLRNCQLKARKLAENTFSISAIRDNYRDVLDTIL